MGGTGDKRDATTWVVFELTRQGELKVEEGVLAGLIREVLRAPSDLEVFVPAITYYVGGNRITTHLMQGYVFVASSLSDAEYMAVENSLYIRKALTTRGPHGMRILSVVPDVRIEDLRLQMQQLTSSDVKVGMQVQITEGPLTNLDALVLELEPDHAHVQVILRSLDLIARIPRIFLVPFEEVTP